MGTYLDNNGDTKVETLNVTLPSTFKVEFEALFNQTANNSCFFRVGETDTKALLVGKVGSNDTVFKVYARNGTDLITTGSSITTSNDYQPFFFSYNGTTFNFNDDISVTNLNGVSLNTLISCASWKGWQMGITSGRVRYIKVKPL